VADRSNSSDKVRGRPVLVATVAIVTVISLAVVARTRSTATPAARSATTALATPRRPPTTALPATTTEATTSTTTIDLRRDAWDRCVTAGREVLRYNPGKATFGDYVPDHVRHVDNDDKTEWAIIQYVEVRNAFNTPTKALWSCLIAPDGTVTADVVDAP
jgi:hypothetical protein